MSVAPPLPNLEDMTAVESSVLKAWHYDIASGRLTVRFHHGGAYSYDGVTPKDVEEIKAAKSIGKHFAANIRHRPHVKHEEPKK